MFALDVQQEIWFKLIKDAEKKELRIKEMLIATKTKCLTHTYNLHWHRQCLEYLVEVVPNVRKYRGFGYLSMYCRLTRPGFLLTLWQRLLSSSSGYLLTIMLSGYKMMPVINAASFVLFLLNYEIKKS